MWVLRRKDECVRFCCRQTRVCGSQINIYLFDHRSCDHRREIEVKMAQSKGGAAFSLGDLNVRCRHWTNRAPL